jgi:PKHD-type hydroxylase
MLLQVPEVLSAEQVRDARRLLDAADWVDGRVTAGFQSGRVKQNQQLPEDAPAAREVGETILRSLQRHPLFMSAALPYRIFPPLFNSYRGGQAFGNHVDNAIRQVTGTPHRIRTDLSATLFLSDPADYDGGELIVDLRHARRQAAGRPSGALPGDEPAPGHPCHARRARLVVLLDPEHGA